MTEAGSRPGPVASSSDSTTAPMPFVVDIETSVTRSGITLVRGPRAAITGLGGGPPTAHTCHGVPLPVRPRVEDDEGAVRRDPVSSVVGWDMSETMAVRCPDCGREHEYAAPAYPCACGTPVAPPLNRRAAPVCVTHRTWDEDWVTVRCGSCGRADQWPHPELGCSCGTVLRVPVTGAAEPHSPANGDPVEPPAEPPTEPAAEPRATFQPVTIRTARDAVTAVALYLRWLGYRDVRRADRRQPHGIGLCAPGVLAQVHPLVEPASLRDVECLWLTALAESRDCVHFSLAGYADDARDRADRLGVALFVLDLTGTPQPVNAAAVELVATGAGA